MRRILQAGLERQAAGGTMETLRSSVGVRRTRGLQAQEQSSHGSSWIITCSRGGRRLVVPSCQRRFAAASVTASWKHDHHQANHSSICAPPPGAVASDVQVGVQQDRSPPLLSKQKVEELLEKVIYNCRFFTLLGVSGSLLGSVLCFLKGSVCVATSFAEYFMTGGKIISVLIEAIDVYVIGTAMLVFGMGLYELFISNLDMAKISSQRSNFLGLFMLKERPRWLQIQSVNELKTKFGHVIVMVLLVGLFDRIQKVVISTPMDLLCFTASILLSSCGLYLLSKLTHPKTKIN